MRFSTACDKYTIKMHNFNPHREVDWLQVTCSVNFAMFRMRPEVGEGWAINYADQARVRPGGLVPCSGAADDLRDVHGHWQDRIYAFADF